jgi:hypothetical protein
VTVTQQQPVDLGLVTRELQEDLGEVLPQRGPALHPGAAAPQGEGRVLGMERGDRVGILRLPRRVVAVEHLLQRLPLHRDLRLGQHSGHRDLLDLGR